MTEKVSFDDLTPWENDRLNAIVKSLPIAEQMKYYESIEDSDKVVAILISEMTYCLFEKKIRSLDIIFKSWYLRKYRERINISLVSALMDFFLERKKYKLIAELIDFFDLHLNEDFYPQLKLLPILCPELFNNNLFAHIEKTRQALVEQSLDPDLAN